MDFMRRKVCLVLVTASLVVVQASADGEWGEEEEEQLSLCTNQTKVTRLTQIYESGRPTDRLNLYLETGADVCAMFSFKADGEVVSVGASGLSTDWQNSRSTGFRHVFVPSIGTYQAKGDHYSKLIASGAQRHWGRVDDTVTMEALDEEEPPPDEEEDCTLDGSCPDDPGCGPFSCSPIVIDMSRNGYALTSDADGVFFDIDADGDMDRVAWTRPDSDDAWLAMDRNGNGQIDDGSELFGNRTRVFADPTALTTAANGFEALKFLESPPYGFNRADNVIDTHDAAFARLLLWTDRNHNGISEADELQSVNTSALQAIHTDYKEAKKRDRYGNEFRQRAKGVWEDGYESHVYDVWLRMQ